VRFLIDLGGEQNRSQQDEVAELRMNDVAMDPHPAETRGHGHRLVGDDPDFPRKPAHLHRKTARRIHGPMAGLLESPDDLPADLVHMVGRLVKLEIRDGTLRAADRFAVHPADEADQRFRGRKCLEDVRPLIFEFAAEDRHEADIVGSRIENDPPQFLRGHPLSLRQGCPPAVSLHGRVIFEDGHRSRSIHLHFASTGLALCK
jgi:hypothetical protein